MWLETNETSVLEEKHVKVTKKNKEPAMWGKDWYPAKILKKVVSKKYNVKK